MGPERRGFGFKKLVGHDARPSSGLPSICPRGRQSRRPAPRPSPGPPRAPIGPEAAAEPTFAEEVTPPPTAIPPLVITGYVDVGFAKAQGDGTSFPDSCAPARRRAPPTTTSTRSRPRSTRAARWRRPRRRPGTTIVNGFLPRCAGIGGKPRSSQYGGRRSCATRRPSCRCMVFTRLQLVPRLYGPSAMPDQREFPAGEYTRLFSSRRSAASPRSRTRSSRSASASSTRCSGSSTSTTRPTSGSASRRRSIARYTTGQSIGVKVFYRVSDIPSVVGGQPQRRRHQQRDLRRGAAGPVAQPDRRAGRVGAARLRAEPGAGLLKLGASAAYGPRNDQSDRDSRTDALRVRRAGVPPRPLAGLGEYVARRTRRRRSGTTSS